MIAKLSGKRPFGFRLAIRRGEGDGHLVTSYSPSHREALILPSLHCHLHLPSAPSPGHCRRFHLPSHCSVRIYSHLHLELLLHCSRLHYRISSFVPLPSHKNPEPRLALFLFHPHAGPSWALVIHCACLAAAVSTSCRSHCHY